MALDCGKDCPLCGVKMSQGDRLFKESHFIADPDHDLSRFSDVVMHLDGYAPWAHRRRFARMDFESNVEWGESNPYWGIAHRDDRFFGTVNPSTTVGEVDVLLAETGRSFRINMGDCETWFDGCHHEVKRAALADVIRQLRSKFPSAHAMVACAYEQKA